MKRLLRAMHRLKHQGLSLLGLAAVLATPLPAMAQDQTVHLNYLNDLYSFLASQDADAHTIARNVTDEWNVLSAQAVCEDLRSGIQPGDLYSETMSYAMQQISIMAPGAPLDSIAYSMGLYVGSAMNLGSAYYCPQYQEQVIQALSQL